jgi:hypothetical protein
MERPEKKGVSLRGRAYSNEETVDIYELGRMWLETGQHRKAESIMVGLNEVAPDFAPAWMGSAVLRALASDFEGALTAAKHALRIEPDNSEAMLFVVSLSLSVGDVSTAGTYLGEVSERIDQGRVANPHSVRLYKMQMSRFQSRGFPK